MRPSDRSLTLFLGWSFDQRRAMFALFSGTVIERNHLARRRVLKTQIQGIRK